MIKHLIANNPIKSRDELTVGKTIWHVYGYYGASGIPTKETITSEPYYEDNYWWFTTDTNPYEYPRSCGDCNIGSHHNSNYIFDNEADAISYGQLVQERNVA